MIALSSGFKASARSIAASTRSAGEASPLRTRSACAVASSLARSSVPIPLPFRNWRSLVEQVLQPDDESLGQVADPAYREEDSGHEAGPVGRIVSDRERLAGA